MAVKKNPSIGNAVVRNTTKPELPSTKLFTVPTGQHEQQHICQQQTGETTENFELQVKKCNLPVAVSNLRQ